jgi:hypothetical protein
MGKLISVSFLLSAGMTVIQNTLKVAIRALLVFKPNYGTLTLVPVRVKNNR